MDRKHLGGAGFSALFYQPGTEWGYLQRPSAADVQDLRVRIHHWAGVLFSGHAHARRQRRGGAIRYQLGAAIVAVRHSSRRRAGPIHHRVFRARITWHLDPTWQLDRTKQLDPTWELDLTTKLDPTKLNPTRRRLLYRDCANPSVRKRS